MAKQQIVKLDQILDPENVAHLFAVAVDRDRLAENGGNREPSDPPLVLDSKLAGAVDTGLPEHHGPQAIDPMIVPDVLIGTTFGAAIGGVKIEWIGLVNPSDEFTICVATVFLDDFGGIHLPVNFIGR